MLCYVDYTCGHSYRAWSWLRDVDTGIEWRTFSLKEVNRDPDEPRVFEDPSSISVCALALAHAARSHEFLRYHAGAFDAFHERRVERDELVELAAHAGVPAGDLDMESLFAAVEREHDEAVARWSAFGTPTLVFDDGATAFLRIEEPPRDGRGLWLRTEALVRAGTRRIHIDGDHAGPAA